MHNVQITLTPTHNKNKKAAGLQQNNPTQCHTALVVARGEDEERLVRVRVRLGSGLVERVVVARGEDMRSACAAHSSTQRARRALVARVEVRQIGWPYLSKASNIVY